MTEFIPGEDWQNADELQIMTAKEKAIQNELLIIRGIAGIGVIGSKVNILTNKIIS